MSSLTAPNETSRRMKKDVTKLVELNYQVELIDDVNDFTVVFHGPKGSLYENGMWRLRVHLPENYPFKSPLVRFMNKIYHPNIDESSGTICLDAINQDWTALYDLVNVFESLLPQLLLYPNPHDPLNGEAASLLLSDSANYKRIVLEHVRKNASQLPPIAIASARAPATPSNSVAPVLLSNASASGPDLFNPTSSNLPTSHFMTPVVHAAYSITVHSPSFSCVSSSGAPRSHMLPREEVDLGAANKQHPAAARCSAFCVTPYTSNGSTIKNIHADSALARASGDMSRKRKWRTAADTESDNDSDVSSLSSPSDSEDDSAKTDSDNPSDVSTSGKRSRTHEDNESALCCSFSK